MKDYRTHSLPYLEKFKKIKLVVSDNDGVLTDGMLIFEDQLPGINYNVLDGYGIRCLQEAGIEFAIISGRSSKALARRAELLKIKHLIAGHTNKIIELEKLMKLLGVTAQETLYIGDDIIDLPCFDLVGLKIAVDNAHPSLKDEADYVTLNKGGHGAVREVIDMVLIAQEKQDFFTSWL